MPTEFPRLENSFLERNPEPSFREIAYEMAKPYVENEIPDTDLESIIQDCYPFSSKVVPSSIGSKPFGGKLFLLIL